jgi:hypothetical protein
MLDHVSLAFDDDVVLRDVSFSVAAGDMADPPAARAVKFLMLKEGRVYFEGTATELRASPDPFLHTFLTGWVPPRVDSMSGVG